jgi:hypothetical protein
MSSYEQVYDMHPIHIPKCFKGVFTSDEFGNIRSLRNKEEVKNLGEIFEDDKFR